MSFYGLWKGWELVDVLGKDDFGAVYTAKVDGEPIDSVVKVVNIPTDAEIIDNMLADGKSLSDAENILQPIVDSWIDEIISKDTMAGNENVVKIQDYKLTRYPYAPIWIIYIRLEKLSTVKDYFAKNLATSNSVAKLGADICNALEMCGNVNIKKSEVNPSKIYVNDNGTFKLGGFESSKGMTIPGYMESAASFSDYLAPEVCNGGEVTPLANMYSLGLVMYEQINGGKLPFVSDMNNEDERKAALEKRLDKFVSFDAPANSDNALAKIIAKATAFAPKERFASFKEMGRAIRAYIDKDFKSLNMIFDGQSNEVFKSDEKARANSEEAKLAAARAAEEAALLKRQEEAAARAVEEERKKVEKLKKEQEAAAAKEMDEERKAAEKRDAKDNKLAKARIAEEAKLAEQKVEAERKEAEKKEAEEKAAALAAAVAAKELAKQKEAEEKKKLEDEKKAAKEKAEKQKADAAAALVAKQTKEAEAKQKAKEKAKKDKADAKAAKKAAKEKAKNDKLLAKQNAKDAKKKVKADKALAAITAKKAAEAEELKRKQAEIEAKNKAEAEKKSAEEKAAKEKAAVLAAEKEAKAKAEKEKAEALAAENAAKELAKQKEAEEKKQLEEERKAAKERAEQQKAAAAAALAAKQAAEIEELRRRQAEADAKKKAEAEKKAAEEKASKEKEAKKKAAAVAAANAAKEKAKSEKLAAKSNSKDTSKKNTGKKSTDKKASNDNKKNKSSAGKYIIIALIIIVVIVAFLLILRSCTDSGNGDITTTGTTTSNITTTAPSGESTTEPTTEPTTKPTTEPTTEPTTQPTTTTTTNPTTTTTKPITTTTKPVERPDNSAGNRSKVVNGVYTSVDGRFQLDVPAWKSTNALPSTIVPQNYISGYDNAIKIDRVPYISDEYVSEWTKEMFEQTLNVTIEGEITTLTLNGGYICYKITAVSSSNVREYIYVFQVPYGGGINSGRYILRFMQAEGKPDMKSISEQIMSTIKFF